MFEEEAKQRQRLSPGRPEKGGGKPSPPLKRDESQRAAAQAAKATGAGVKSTQQLAAVKKAAPEVFNLAKQGKASVAEAKQIAALPPEARSDVIAMVREGAAPREAVASIEHVSSAHRALGSSLSKLTTIVDRAMLEIQQASDVLLDESDLELSGFGAWALVKRIDLLQPKLREFAVLLRSRAGEE